MARRGPSAITIAKAAGWEMAERGWWTKEGVGICQEADGEWWIHADDAPRRGGFQTLLDAIRVADSRSTEQPEQRNG